MSSDAHHRDFLARFILITAGLIVVFSRPTFADEKKIALVYKGPGVCVEDCAQAAAEAARKVGLKIKYIGPSESNVHIFDDAAVWLQPGGGSKSAGLAMTSQLKENIRSFVYRGGGYVGFCAGAPVAASKIHDSEIDGLGILPGVQIHKYLETGNENPTVLKVQWNGSPRYLYWEAGSYMTVDKSFNGKATSFYPNGLIASLRLSYGKGRVFVTGLHPEAPDSWKKLAKLSDPDGSDISLAEEMVRWAVGQ
jgi:glutamine amidotransferase-like uncharacterized protein